MAEARATLLAYPAQAYFHTALFDLLGESAPLTQRLRELEVALWLDPRDPFARDRYADTLRHIGKEQEGLREITQSVFFSPDLSTHSYLDREEIQSLAPRELEAVEEGLQRAVLADYPAAVNGLGYFYSALRRFAEAGKVYEEAGLRERKPNLQLGLRLNAGLAYARAREPEKAEALFRQVISAEPKDPRAYQYLATQVFAPREEIGAAKAIISEGIHHGADPLVLLVALAEAEQKAGDREEAKATLMAALALQRESFDAHFLLGRLYLQEKNFERASLELRKATKLNPKSAAAFSALAQAQEGRYQFFAAREAYTRAINLDPDNIGLQRRYEAFQRKVDAK
jgi:tetratricopeptide (TPR) repeat protein